MTALDFAASDVGRKVLAQRNAKGNPVLAVLVDVSETGAPCIARLTKDGVIRQEAIWAAMWHSVSRA